MGNSDPFPARHPAEGVPLLTPGSPKTDYPQQPQLDSDSGHEPARDLDGYPFFPDGSGVGIGSVRQDLRDSDASAADLVEPPPAETGEAPTSVVTDAAGGDDFVSDGDSDFYASDPITADATGTEDAFAGAEGQATGRVPQWGPYESGSDPFAGRVPAPQARPWQRCYGSPCADTVSGFDLTVRFERTGATWPAFPQPRNR